MIIVRVTYTVKEDYVNTNKERINEFLEEFKSLDNSQFLYTIFQTPDDNTFIHQSQYKNKDIQQKVLRLRSFLQFQELRDKNLVSEPSIEFLHYVGASKDVL